MRELAERSGVAERTIRGYITQGWVPRPGGRGKTATYGRRHLLSIFALAQYRRENVLLESIGPQLAEMTDKELEEFMPKPASAAPPPEPPPALKVESAPAPPPIELESEPEPAPRVAPTSPRELAQSGDLPDGPKWVLVSLLPGMALMVREDAAPIVRRAAAEIVSRYGAPG